MILTGEEIKSQLGKNIVIEPFDEKQLNPNSYNLRLHDELIVYEEIVLDVRRPNRYRRHIIPPEGFVLHPGQLYLGRTIERTETHDLVPMLEGRSCPCIVPRSWPTSPARCSPRSEVVRCPFVLLSAQCFVASHSPPRS